MKYYLFTKTTTWAANPLRSKEDLIAKHIYLLKEEEGNIMKPVAEKVLWSNSQPLPNPVWVRPPNMGIIHGDYYNPLDGNSKEISKAEATAIMLVAVRRQL